VLFILAVAACEAGVALAFFVTLWRRQRSLDSSDLQELRELGTPAATDDEPLVRPVEEPDPVLTPAGARPQPVTTAEEAARV
jgi:NADH-quinone oxidoreductase subunit K